MATQARPTKNVRLNLSIPKQMRDKLRCVREITGLGSDPEAARYLMSRGVESMSGQIKAVEAVHKLEETFTPTEMLPLYEAAQEAANRK